MSSEQSGAGTRLLEEVREVVRRNHYSIHTERIYFEWVRRFVRFQGMLSHYHAESRALPPPRIRPMQEVE